MSKNKKKKKSAGGTVVVFILLVLMLAALLALKFFGIGAPAPTAPTETPAEEIVEPETTEEPEATAAPAPASVQNEEVPVMLEDAGEIEIIIPDDMEGEGF